MLPVTMIMSTPPAIARQPTARRRRRPSLRMEAGSFC
jgi:hypothetical protein